MCKELRISFAKQQRVFDPVIIEGKGIVFVTSTNLLGLTIANDLTWNDHVTEITKKASKRLYFLTQLRTVPTIVIAHTFCASRDTRIFYRRCLLIQEYFCAVQNYAEKAELSILVSKKKIGGNHAFFRDN